MNSRRKDSERIRAQKKSKLISFRALRLFILFFFFIQFVSSQTNVTIQQYDINDPRNPDCPCHKYQQIADDEYKKMKNEKQKKEERLEALNNDIQHYNNNQNKKGESAISGADSNKKLKKKKSFWYYKKSNRNKLKHSKIKKLKPNYSVCYKW